MILKIVMSIVCLVGLASAIYVVYDGIKMIKDAGGFKEFDKELEEWLSK